MGASQSWDEYEAQNTAPAQDLTPAAAPRAAPTSWDDYEKRAAEEPVQGDVSRGFETALRQTPALFKGLVGLFGASAEKMFGEGGISTDVKEWGTRGYVEGMEKIQPITREHDDVTVAWDRAMDGDIGAMVDWAQYAFGYGMAQVGETAVIGIASGLVGGAMTGGAGAVPAAVGGVAAKGAAKGFLKGLIEKEIERRVTKGLTKELATKQLARDIGAATGLAAYNQMIEGGATYGEAVEHAEERGRELNGTDLARIWGAATVAGASETIPDLIGLGAIFGRFSGMKIPGGGTRLGTAAVGGAGGVALEAGQEAFQTAAERYGAGKELTGDDARNEYINAAAMAAIPGGLVGTVAGGMRRPAQPAPPAPATPDTRPSPGTVLTSPDVPSAIDQAIEASGAGPEAQDLADKTEIQIGLVDETRQPPAGPPPPGAPSNAILTPEQADAIAQSYEDEGAGITADVSQPAAPNAPVVDEAPPAAAPMSEDALGALFDEAAGEVSAEAAATTVDEGAQEAATSPENALPEPTQPQKKAGNYQKGHVAVAGLDVSVENPAGSVRSGKDEGGKPWSVTMKSHYGYIKGVAARAPDKEHVDVFVKTGATEAFEGEVYVVDQKKASGRFDEPKVMIGFQSLDEARAAYLKNYAAGWEKNVLGITPMPMAEFKTKLDDEKAFLYPQQAVTTPESAAATAESFEAEGEAAPSVTEAAAETGKPFKARLARGSGAKLSPYNEIGPQTPILGEGRYTSSDREYIKDFGPEVTEHDVELTNPLVISSDTQWRALTKRAGWEYPNPLRPDDKAKTQADIDAMRAMLEKDGHDGVVVQVPESEAVGKLLQRVFGASQVVEFKSKAEETERDKSDLAPPAETVHDLAIESLRSRGWNLDWPFVPADLINADFRELIKNDPEISQAEKNKILSFAPDGKNYESLKDVLSLEPLEPNSYKVTQEGLEREAAADKAEAAWKAHVDAFNARAEARGPGEAEETGGEQVTPGAYASGMSRFRDMAAAIKSAVGVGTAIGELSKNGIDQLAAAIAAGKSAFVDSGAFNAFKRGLKGKDASIDYDKVMSKYEDLAQKVREGHQDQYNNALLMMVAPDVVGDQASTMKLLEKYAERLRVLMDHGHEIIVPFQHGAMKQSEAYRKVAEILGGHNFVVGIPSAVEALTDAEVSDLIADPYGNGYQPQRIHILGAVSEIRLEPRMKIIREAYKDNVPGVTADAMVLRSKLSQVVGLTGEEKFTKIVQILDNADIKTPSVKVAEAKKAEQATREAERDLFVAVVNDPDLMAVVNDRDESQLKNSLLSIETAVNKIIGKRIGELSAIDPAGARAVNAAQISLRGEKKDEFLKAVRAAILNAKRLAEKEENRNPEHYKAALEEAQTEDNIGADEVMRDSYKSGWDHALAGKTKSTLTGDLLNVINHGYDAARKWMKTPIGRDWYTGKRGKKLENTGADLRRWFDVEKAKIDALKGRAGEAWKQIEKSTDRAGLFRDLASEDATPGTLRYLERLRKMTPTFIEWVEEIESSPLNRVFMHGRYRGDGATLSSRMDDFLKGDLTDVPQWDSDEKRRDGLKAAADEYLEIVRPVIEAVRGAMTIDGAVNSLTAVMGTGKRLPSGVSEGITQEGQEFHSIVGHGNGAWRDLVRVEGIALKVLKRDELTPLTAADRSKPLVPPRLDSVERKSRKDHRKGKDVTPAEAKKQFNFADVGFGNWVPAGGDQDHLNYGYDAFMDLAEELGMPPEQIGLGGTLYFTIGALGHGKFAAHFSPNQPGPTGPVAVINLTNTKGDGTVAHEWGHALDHHLGNKGVADVVKGVKSGYDVVWLEKEFMKFLTGGWYYKRSKGDKVRNAKHHMDMTSSSGKTQYLIEAEKLGKDYWGNDAELFARSWEAWLFDKMGKNGNTYLVNPWVADSVTGPPEYRGWPYPRGEERKSFVPFFDAFLKALEWTDKGPVFNKDKFTAPEVREAFNAKRDELKRNADAIFQEGLREQTQERQTREATRLAEAEAKAREIAAALAAEEAAAAIPTPIGPMNEDELNALFDEAAAGVREDTQEQPDAPSPGEPSMGTPPEQVGKQPPKASDQTPAKDDARTAAKLAKEAAKLGVEGVDEAMAGLVKLFGGGRIQSFPGGFDESAYKAAKPHFQAALEKFQAAGKTLKDLFKFLIQQFGEGMKPYAVRFAKDLELSSTLSPPANPSIAMAHWVQGNLTAGRSMTWQELFGQADKSFGGTQAEGTYTPKDAYDAMEAGVNLYIRKGGWTASGSAADAEVDIANLERMTQTLPTQSKRTAETDEFQQFSTPPAYAYLLNWAANLRQGETVMEPSAGIGGIAIFADNAGASLVLNELSKRRAGVLQALFPRARHFSEDAAQIDNILPDSIVPTAVVMNPPFSATAGRKEGTRDTMEGARHIEQALRRLAKNGRLVAIVGEGMAADKPAFKEWWTKIQKAYNVRANIGIDGSGYAKYGTTFDNQVLVIDNDGPTVEPVTTGKLKTVAEVLPLLEGIRNGRPQATEQTPTHDALGQPDAIEPAGETAPAAGLGGTTGDVAQPGAGPVADSGRGGGGPGGPDSGPAVGEGGGTGTDRPARGDGLPDADGGRGRDGDAGTPEGAGPGGSGVVSDAGAFGQDGVDGRGLVQQGEFTDAIFENYVPQRLTVPGSKPHKGALVQSSAMAAVIPPKPTYTPNLPKKVIDEGMLSLPQIEAVIYAGQAHSELLPNGQRRGFMIGDGTGVGKGREVGGIILDNLRQGRKKAMWFSQTGGLIKDAKRDYGDVSGDPSLIFGIGDAKTKVTKRIPNSEGVLFTTYSMLRGEEKKQLSQGDAAGGKKAPRTRLEQIVEWAGPDFDGVIVFDESHNLGNAFPIRGVRGVKPVSKQAVAGVALQERLPKARIVYVSATAATEVANLTYATRLGLWGEGTAFAAIGDFVNKIAAAGVSAMELVARDMKAMGSYIARSLSFDGIEYERETHELTDLQREAYDVMAGAWAKVMDRINEALDETGQAHNGTAKGNARGQFYGSMQRFFNQLITAMQMPTILKMARKDIDAGHAVVLQLVDTNEAEQERQYGARKRPSATEEEILEDFEFGPMDGLIEYIKNGFPIQQFESFTKDDGTQGWRGVFDAAGEPVFSKEAIRIRDALIVELQEIAKSQAIPGNPLDMVIEEFGTDEVAEVTGRGRRFVKQSDGKGGYKIVEEKRGKNATEADSLKFMDDQKRVLIFSKAGGTGFSYQADNRVKNQRLRRHYLVQPGWQADRAVQGFGRTHRTNQKQPPEYILVTTDIKAQKRFISSIARRLDQLGALTKGERKTASQGLFTAADNLESGYAAAALRSTLTDLRADRIPGLSFPILMAEMGLEIADPRTGGFIESKMPNMQQFLNRMLALKLDTQTALFDAFSERMDELVQSAIEAGTFDDGMQTLQAIKIEKTVDEVVYTEPRTGSTTRYVDLELTHPTVINQWDDVAAAEKAAGKDFSGYYRDNRTGHVFAVVRRGRRVHNDGKEYVKGSRWDVSGRRRLIDNVLNIEREKQETVKKTVEDQVYGGDENDPALIKEYEGGLYGGKQKVYGRHIVASIENLGLAAVEAEIREDAEDTVIRKDLVEEAKAKLEVLAEIKKNLVKRSVERRVPHYEKLDQATAAAEWAEQVKAAPKTFTEHTHMISGIILPIWDRFADGQTRVARAQTVDGERFLGRVVLPKDLSATLRNLGVNTMKNVTPAQALERVRGGETAVLSNGWRVRFAKVSGGNRVEIMALTGMTSGDQSLLTEQGVFKERINWKERWFIPSGEHELAIFKRITSSKPVVEMVGKDGATSFARGGKSPKKAVSLNKARAAVAAVARRWKNAPMIHVIESMDDAPDIIKKRDEDARSTGAKGDVRGFIHRGEVYVVSSAHTSAADVITVLMHESFGHFGLRGTLGTDIYDVLDEVARSQEEMVRARAKKYGLDFNDITERRQAAEEVLAFMAQNNPQASLVMRAVAAIRRFLRSIGVDLKLSTKDIIVNFIVPAREFVAEGAGTEQGQAAGATEGSFSRDRPRGKPTQEFGFVGMHEITTQYRVSDIEKYSITTPEYRDDEVVATPGRRQIKKPILAVVRDPGDPASSIEIVNGWHRVRQALANKDEFIPMKMLFDPNDQNEIKRSRVQQRLVRDVETGEVTVDQKLIADQIDTPLFKDWFGDSKVVDENGKPLVVYHGGAKLTQFDVSRAMEGGFFFSADEWLAMQFQRKGGATYAVYLSLKNPKTVSADDFGWWENNEYGKEGYVHDEGMKASIIAQAMKEGFDGLIAENIPEGGEDFEPSHQYVAFYPEQIKSAIGNRGTFDPNNPDIRFARSAEDQKLIADQIDTPLFKDWFGDSKVVDENGDPLRVYHGTPGGKDFSVFDRMASGRSGADVVGSWFTTARQAELYSGDEGSLIPVYLALKNPLIIDRPIGSMSAEGAIVEHNKLTELQKELKKTGGLNKVELASKAELDAIALERGTRAWTPAQRRKYEAYRDSGEKRLDRIRSALASRDDDSMRQLFDMVEKSGGGDALRTQLIEQGYDGIILKNTIGDSGFRRPPADMWIAFEAEQIKSATGNRGTFDPNNPDIRFARSAEGILGAGGDFTELVSKVRRGVGNHLRSQRGFNRWWHRTVGTQFHKATINKWFKRVFDLGQDYLTDTSRYAMRAEAFAPDLLLRMEGLRDLVKRGIKKAEIVKLARPVFEGTLIAKKVYTDEELREKFDLNDKEIDHYRQFRAAVDSSLEELARSAMAKMAKAVGIQMSATKSLRDLPFDEYHKEVNDLVKARARFLTDALADLDPGAADYALRKAKVEEARKQGPALVKMFNQVRRLQKEGYAPLMRFGEYTVYVTRETEEGETEELFFNMYETQAAANEAAMELAEEFPDGDITQGIEEGSGASLYKGLSPDTIEIFAKASGLDEDPLFQTYLRLAANTNSAMKRMIHRKGTPGFSEDVTRVLATFVTSNARLTSSNWHLGEMQAAVDAIPKRMGDVKKEAEELWKYLTDPREEAGKLRGFLFFQFLGGSIASAMVNATQPITMSAPYFAQFVSALKAAAHLRRASMEAATNKPGADVKALYDRAVEDGIVAPHEIYQLMAQARGNVMGSSGGGRFLKLWGSFFSLAEAFNRRTTFIAAARIAQETGVTDVYDFAKTAVADTQGLYNKGNRPNWARGAFGATIFTFKQFSIAYVEFLKRLHKNDKPAFFLALAILTLLAGLEGLPFAEDIEDVIDTIGQWLGHSTNSKKWLRNNANRVFGEGVGQFLLHGVSTIPGVPLDVSLRLGMHNLIPGTAVLKPSETNRARDAIEFMGPVGGVLESAGRALEAAAKGESYRAAHSIAPLAVRNALKGAEMWEKGYYTDTRGRRVLDTNTGEAILKAAGFQPASVATESRNISIAYQDIAANRTVEAGIADKWARAIFSKDKEGVTAAREELRRWNTNNPDQRIRITGAQIVSRLRAMKASRAQRFIKTAPPELRRGIAADIR